MAARWNFLSRSGGSGGSWRRVCPSERSCGPGCLCPPSSGRESRPRRSPAASGVWGEGLPRGAPHVTAGQGEPPAAVPAPVPTPPILLALQAGGRGTDSVLTWVTWVTSRGRET